MTGGTFKGLRGRDAVGRKLNGYIVYGKFNGGPGRDFANRCGDAATLHGVEVVVKNPC